MENRHLGRNHTFKQKKLLPYAISHKESLAQCRFSTNNYNIDKPVSRIGTIYMAKKKISIQDA